jgi:hypothetical protein
VCGAKGSSRFRAFQSCAHIKGFEGAVFLVPNSDVVCNSCHQSARRGTLLVSSRLFQVARSSHFAIVLPTFSAIFPAYCAMFS